VAHGGIGALLSTEVGSKGVGCVAALEPSLTGRWGPELLNMWQHVEACPTSCLDLESG
jgi:hypothetical protein